MHTGRDMPTSPAAVMATLRSAQAKGPGSALLPTHSNAAASVSAGVNLSLLFPCAVIGHFQPWCRQSYIQVVSVKKKNSCHSEITGLQSSQRQCTQQRTSLLASDRYTCESQTSLSHSQLDDWIAVLQLLQGQGASAKKPAGPSEADPAAHLIADFNTPQPPPRPGKPTTWPPWQRPSASGRTLGDVQLGICISPP